MDTILDTVQSAGAYAVLVVVAVEAVRKQIAFDGWKVLLVAGGCSLAVAMLFLPAYDLQSLIGALRIAITAWLLAVGGDAWVSKLATKSKTVSIVPTSLPREEMPTKKDVP